MTYVESMQKNFLTFKEMTQNKNHASKRQRLRKLHALRYAAGILLDKI